MKTRKTIYFNQINGRVDTENGVVRGVSVITEGQAKGHDLHVDSTTLQQLLELGASSPSGRVKTKLNHKSGIESVFGYLTEFRISGPKLIADLYLLKNHKDYDQTLEQIREMPEDIGLSVAFTGKPEVINGKKFARAESIVSTDLVPEPAANPTGMFSEGPFLGEEYDDGEVDSENNGNMDPLEQILAQLNQINERLDSQEDMIAGLGDQGLDDDGDGELITEAQLEEAVAALQSQGFAPDEIQEILDQEIEAIYDEAGYGDGEDYEDGDGEDYRNIDGDNLQRQPAMAGGGSGIHGGSEDSYEDQGGDGGELSQLRQMVHHLAARLENDDQATAEQAIAVRFDAIKDRVAQLAADNETLAAENSALFEAVRTGSTLSVPSAPATMLSAGAGAFEDLVQTFLSEGKTKGEAIQLAARTDRGAHSDWLKRQGVLPVTAL